MHICDQQSLKEILEQNTNAHKHIPKLIITQLNNQPKLNKSKTNTQKVPNIMQSIFRIYAKTTKQNDKYLFNQLLSMGLQPKYQELLHAFYFNANFNHLFKLSFQAFTVESLYLQLGHRYPLSTEYGENERSVGEFLKKINFRNYLPIQRGIVENTTLRLLIRESSPNLPSENAIISFLQNYLQKQVILKQYRKMSKKQQRDKLQNYYDIKHIVQKKWQHEDIIKQNNKKLFLQNQKQESLKYLDGLGRNTKKQRKQQKYEVEQYEQKANQLANLFDVPYSPHFIMYIRRNHARLLLKLNTESLHKFGWKKNVGWGPIRQTLTASILYRTGLIQHFKQKKEINLWDPFCGSGTIPLVALSMAKQLKVRQDHTTNFIWSKWPIYNQNYLTEYLEKSKQLNQQTKINVLCSDIDINSVKNTVNNFRQFVSKNTSDLTSEQTAQQNFLHFRPSDQIYEILPKSVYIGCGDFEQLAQKILHNKNKKTTIITNLPYLGQRSKQHHPLNQLHSIYKRFNNIINKYKQYIENVFVIVDSDVHNSNHFIKVSKQQWRILEHFSNGGIEICLLGWSGNKVGWKEVEVYQEKSNKGMEAYDQEKLNNLQEYRKEVKEVQNKIYQLPAHLGKKEGLTKNKRVLQKRRVRHLLAAYSAFSKRRDKNQIFEKYARKNLALRLSQRGKSWKRKNIALVNNKIQENEGIIRKQFENRIEEAIKRSQQMKLRKNRKEVAAKRKW